MQQVRMQGESGLCGPLSLLRRLPSQDETAIYGFVNPWHQPSPSANTCSASSSIVTGCPAERFSTTATSPRMQPVNCPFCGQSKSQDHLLLLLSIVHTRPTSGFLPTWAPAVRTHGHFGMCKQSIPRKKEKKSTARLGLVVSCTDQFTVNLVYN